MSYAVGENLGAKLGIAGLKKLSMLQKAQSVDVEEIKHYEKLEEIECTRGTLGSELNKDLQNFSMVYGCRPGSGVRADTKMIEDVANTFAKQYDRDTLSAIFPRILDDLKGKDANFEMISLFALGCWGRVFGSSLFALCPGGKLNI